MSYEEKQQPSAKTHSISMENRTKLSVTGVEDVESFDENAIIMNTSQGDLPRAASGRSFSAECTLTFRSSSRSWHCRC